VLVILQQGRLTELKGDDCSADVFSQHVALRQNVVVWAGRLRWGWPDGGPAQWNPTHWSKGTPRADVSLSDAIDDVFANQNAYTIGCYTATKLVMVKGVLDFYRRTRDLPGMLELVQERLLSDREPLVDIEPAVAWSFEPGFDPMDASKPGKISSIIDNVAPRNFVPGDWVFLLNTDPVSSSKLGHEGSNAIYLGGGRFVDYYGEKNHGFTYVEKLDEVFQWRNGVFDLQRDSAKRQVLPAQDFDRLGRSPARGGLVTSWRIAPAFFGSTIRRSSAMLLRNAPGAPEPLQAPVAGLDEPPSNLK
jgi:hypothetical protein